MEATQEPYPPGLRISIPQLLSQHGPLLVSFCLSETSITLILISTTLLLEVELSAPTPLKLSQTILRTQSQTSLSQKISNLFKTYSRAKMSIMEISCSTLQIPLHLECSMEVGQSFAIFSQALPTQTWSFNCQSWSNTLMRMGSPSTNTIESLYQTLRWTDKTTWGNGLGSTVQNSHGSKLPTNNIL